LNEMLVPMGSSGHFLKRVADWRLSCPLCDQEAIIASGTRV
jgi:hypothetical protein